ncbi:MAG: dTMP kinase [Candidatus Omnitrophota bacterium]
MAEEMKKGIFITFEGPEGSGKSTQSRLLFKELKEEGYDAIHTAEPGGTELGEYIRSMILEKDSVSLSRKAELFLFEADRAQHVEEIISPALDAGKIVICDRFNTATFAYQGYGLGLDKKIIKVLDDIATGGVTPDLTIIMDIDIETGLERAEKVGHTDRMEKRDLEFHERVRQGYQSLAKEDPERIKVITVKEDIGRTYVVVKDVVNSVIERYTRAG